jgi:cell division protein FtsQ
MRPFDPQAVAALRRAQSQSGLHAALDATLRTLAAALLSAALSLGAWQSWRWATGSPLFALREIQFTGLTHAGEAELLQRSGLAPGQNLFRIDLAQAARAIESHPWVASALLERRLPDAIAITVVEHRPAALVQLEQLYLLDEEGRLFKRADRDDHLELPIITGQSREPLRLLAALHILDAWRGAGFALSALAELRLDDGGGVTLLAHDGDQLEEIRLGNVDIPLKLQRLALVRAALQQRGERAARIDLDNPARPDLAAATLAQQR